MKKTLALLAVPVVGVAALSVPADAARAPRNEATLSVSAVAGSLTASNGIKVGNSLVFNGCGYTPGAGVTIVVVSPEATSSFGGPADANGCYSSAQYELYATQVAGTHTAKAYQSSTKRADASVTFSVAP